MASADSVAGKVNSKLSLVQTVLLSSIPRARYLRRDRFRQVRKSLGLFFPDAKVMVCRCQGVQVQVSVNGDAMGDQTRVPIFLPPPSGLGVDRCR